MTAPIKRGQIYYADLSPVVGSEQGGLRPVLVVSNDTNNKYSPTITICPITSQVKKVIPTHMTLYNLEGRKIKGTVLCEQVRTIDKRRLKEHMDTITDAEMAKVNKALQIQFDIYFERERG